MGLSLLYFAVRYTINRKKWGIFLCVFAVKKREFNREVPAKNAKGNFMPFTV